MSAPLDAAAVAELEAIDVAREAAFAELRAANERARQGGTPRYLADLDAVTAAFREVDARAAALQRRVWPRYRGRLVVALGMAVLQSPTGRSTRLVWQRPTGDR